MKKIIILIAVLISVYSNSQDFAFKLPELKLSTKVYDIAADPLINIGKVTLRYDVDSNKLRLGTFGSGIGTVRFAHENNLQLFDFNTAHLSWSTSTGLNIIDPVSHDTSYVKKLSVYKDTTDGENTNIRFFTFSKRFYGNSGTIWNGLLVRYYTFLNGSLSASDSARVIGDASTVHSETFDYEVFADDNWNNLDTVIITERGLYVITYDTELAFPYSDISVGSISDKTDTVQFRLVIAPATENETVISGSLLKIWKHFTVDLGYTAESRTVSKTTSYLYTKETPFQAGISVILQIRGDINTELINAAATEPSITINLVR